MTLTIGAFLGGTSVTQFGYKWAFTFNALSFVFSAACISRLRVGRTGFELPVRPLNEAARSLKTKWCGRGTNTPKACATCARRR